MKATIIYHYTIFPLHYNKRHLSLYHYTTTLYFYCTLYYTFILQQYTRIPLYISIFLQHSHRLPVQYTTVHFTTLLHSCNILLYYTILYFHITTTIFQYATEYYTTINIAYDSIRSHDNTTLYYY